MKRYVEKPSQESPSILNESSLMRKSRDVKFIKSIVFARTSSQDVVPNTIEEDLHEGIDKFL